MITPPPPELVPILKTYCKVFVTGTDHPPPPWNVDDVTQEMSKGGGACECPRVGVLFQFFGGRMTSRGQCPRGGGVLVNVFFATCVVVPHRRGTTTHQGLLKKSRQFKLKVYASIVFVSRPMGIIGHIWCRVPTLW